MTEKPAQFLRETVQAIHELASRASSGGQWTLTAPGKGSAWVEIPGYEHAISAHGFVDEAEYMAAWDPPVALAVARLLDLIAGFTDVAPDSEIVARALTVAKTYRRQS